MPSNPGEIKKEEQIPRIIPLSVMLLESKPGSGRYVGERTCIDPGPKDIPEDKHVVTGMWPAAVTMTSASGSLEGCRRPSGGVALAVPLSPFLPL